MKALEYIEQTRSYLDYLEEHILNVQKAWKLLQEKCCVHMVIDWLAMSFKFGDSPREYYERNKDRIKIPKWSIDLIYEIFRRLEK